MRWPPGARVSILAMAGLAALALAAPGRTFTTVYVNDLLVFLDGAHRIAWGQVPNRDFHTALGPVAFYLPALGRRLGGGLGGAMPLGMAALLLALAPIMAHVLGSRLRSALALPFAALLVLLLAAPLNPGDTVDRLSFAMYYNRIGWVGLALLIVMALPAVTARRHDGLDVAAAAIIVTLLLYTKITYGIVALALLGLIALDHRQRRWAVSTVLVIALAAVLIELVWRGTAAHLQDLIDTARTSGAREPERYVRAVNGSLGELAVFVLVTGVALLRTRRWQDGLLYGCCIGAGLLVVVQNAQGGGVFTLHAGAVVAAEAALRAGSIEHGALPADAGGRFDRLASGLPLLLLVLLVPAMTANATALALHTAAATAGLGRSLGLDGFDGVRFGALWRTADGGFSEHYVESLGKGREDLARLGTDLAPVAVLDFANPFSAGLNLPPPHGDSAWLHWGRNVSAGQHLAPQRLFADAAVVMEPVIGINSRQLRTIYGDYIDRTFAPAYRSAYWMVHVRRPAAGNGG